jgi:hypothetical protein
MAYYVLIIEQIKGETEGTYSEYANVKKYADEQSAEVYFYTRCSEIVNAIGKTHYYGHLKIMNSLGGVIKQDTIGQYVEV